MSYESLKDYNGENFFGRFGQDTSTTDTSAPVSGQTAPLCACPDGSPCPDGINTSSCPQTAAPAAPAAAPAASTGPSFTDILKGTGAVLTPLAAVGAQAYRMATPGAVPGAVPGVARPGVPMAPSVAQKSNTTLIIIVAVAAIALVGVMLMMTKK